MTARRGVNERLASDEDAPGVVQGAVDPGGVVLEPDRHITADQLDPLREAQLQTDDLVLLLE